MSELIKLPNIWDLVLHNRGDTLGIMHIFVKSPEEHEELPIKMGDN